jgi:hypothetical protein
MQKGSKVSPSAFGFGRGRRDYLMERGLVKATTPHNRPYREETPLFDGPSYRQLLLSDH